MGHADMTTTAIYLTVQGEGERALSEHEAIDLRRFAAIAFIRRSRFTSPRWTMVGPPYAMGSVAMCRAIRCLSLFRFSNLDPIPSMKAKTILAAALAAALPITSANAQEKTPGFNQKIPEKIMTRDKVESPPRDAQLRRWHPDRRDDENTLREPRLPARGGGLPELRSRYFPRRNTPRLG
jgi:hypothetical protein